MLLLCSGCGRHRSAPGVVAPPSREVSTSQADADALAARLTALGDASGPYMLTASEAELTSYALANLGDAVNALAIWIEPEGAHIQITMSVRRDHQADALIMPQGADQGVQLLFAHAAVDGHRVPRWILASLEEAANDALADMQLTWRVERVELESGAARVYGVVD